MTDVNEPSLKYLKAVLTNRIEEIHRSESADKFKLIRYYQMQVERVERAQQVLDEASFLYDNPTSADITAQSSVIREPRNETKIIDVIASVISERAHIVSDFQDGYTKNARLDEGKVFALAINSALEETFPDSFDGGVFLNLCHVKKK
jgi:hypothetical protein